MANTSKLFHIQIRDKEVYLKTKQLFCLISFLVFVHQGHVNVYLINLKYIEHILNYFQCIII